MELTQKAIDALENVAQDSTLRGLNLDFSGVQQGLDNLGKSGDEAGKNQMDFTAASLTATKEVAKFGSTVFGSNARISDSYTSLTNIVGAFGSELAGDNKNLKMFGQMVTEGGGALIKAAETGVDTFRTLSTSGASFNNNILEMKNSAAQSRLTLDEFAGIVSSNTQGFAAFGGTVTQGAKQFTMASQNMFDQGLATPLLNMGMTFEEVNEDLAEYMISNRRRYTEEEMRNGTAAKNMIAMSTEMDKIAKLTGKNRKEMEKEIQDRMRKGQVDAKIRMLEASGNKEAADKMRRALAEAEKAGPGALAAVEDLFTKGAVVSEEGRQAAVALGPAFNDLQNMVNYAQGPGGIEGMTNSIDSFNSAIAARVRDPNFLQMATLGGMGNATADAAAQIITGAGTYSDNVQRLMQRENVTREEAIRRLNAAAQTEQENRDGITSTVINGEKALRDLGAVVNDKLIGPNGAFTKLSDAMLPLAEQLGGMNRGGAAANVESRSAEDVFNAASSLVVGGDTTAPTTTPDDIQVQQNTQQAMQQILDHLKNAPRNGMQLGEAKDLAHILGTDIGPILAEKFMAVAEAEGKTITEVVNDRLTQGSSTQIRDAAFDIIDQLNQGNDPNNQIDKDLFQQSMAGLSAVPLDALIDGSDFVVQNMTVANMNGASFNGGTPAFGSLMQDFGKGTLTMLHNKEAVLNEEQIMNLATGVGNMVSAAGPQIAQLTEQLPSAIGSVMQNVQGDDLGRQLTASFTGLKTAFEKVGTDINGMMNSPQTQDGLQQVAELISNSNDRMAQIAEKGHKIASKQLRSLGGLSGNLMRQV